MRRRSEVYRSGTLKRPPVCAAMHKKVYAIQEFFGKTRERSPGGKYASELNIESNGVALDLHRGCSV